MHLAARAVPCAEQSAPSLPRAGRGRAPENPSLRCHFRIPCFPTDPTADLTFAKRGSKGQRRRNQTAMTAYREEEEEEEEEDGEEEEEEEEEEEPARPEGL